MKNLDSLRKKIETIDMQIADLLKSRFDVVEQIGEIKHENGLPICQKEREEELLKEIATMSHSKGECLSYIHRIFRHIFSESCDVQQKAK